MSKRAILYTRVSTDEQADKGYSLQHQLERLQRHCESHGIQSIAHFKEDFSAKTFERPEFRKLIKFSKENIGRVDYIFFLNWSRFSRNAADSYGMIRQLQKLGIEAQAIEQPLDLSVPENKMMLAFYLAAPEVENDRRSLNTAVGMHRAKKEGRFMSKAPFGYRNIRKEDGRGVIVPHPVEAPLVKNLFHEFCTGKYDTEGLRRAMALKGLEVSRSRFPGILRNTVYTGKILVPAFKDEPEHFVKGQHEALIDEHTFQRVQDILDGKGTMRKSSNTTRDEFPLRGFLQCRLCGGAMTASASKGNGGKYYYYHCQKGCEERFKASVANESFQKFLTYIKPKDGVINLYETILKDTFKNLGKTNISEIKKLDEIIDRNRNRISNAQSLMLDAEITSKEYNQIKARFEKENRDLLNQKLELSSGRDDYSEYVSMCCNFLKTMDSNYAKASLEIKRNIIGSIFPGKLIFENSEYRTTRVNEVVSLICLNNSELGAKKGGQPKNNFKLSSQVALAGIEPAS
ncbi:MAG: recombinase family protein [Cyclobacteriaceae bacterium]|nr:recombinase family protein [Cyclobacteriaceae bacterium]